MFRIIFLNFKIVSFKKNISSIIDGIVLMSP